MNRATMLITALVTLFAGLGPSAFAAQTAPGASHVAPAPTNAELRRRSAAMMKADERRREQLHKADMALLARHDKMMDQEERMLAQDEALIKRHAADLARFEKVLDTWQRQQAEYQKYLDSLPRK